MKCNVSPKDHSGGERDIDLRRDDVLVLDLGLGQGGLLDRRPHHRLGAAVELPAVGELEQLGDDRRLRLDPARTERARERLDDLRGRAGVRGRGAAAGVRRRRAARRVAQRGEDLTREAAKAVVEEKKEARTAAPSAASRRRLNFNEKHALETLPKTIAKLQAEIDELRRAVVVRLGAHPDDETAGSTLLARIKDAGIPFRVPDKEELPERLDAVLDVPVGLFACLRHVHQPAPDRRDRR